MLKMFHEGPLLVSKILNGRILGNVIFWLQMSYYSIEFFQGIGIFQLKMPFPSVHKEDTQYERKKYICASKEYAHNVFHGVYIDVLWSPRFPNAQKVP
jgi:hypothetical protein